MTRSDGPSDIGKSEARVSLYAEVDVSGLPWVVVRAVGALHEEGFQRHLEELLEAIQLRERVVIRFHAGSLGALPPRYVRTAATWLKTHQAIATRHVAGAAFVMDSSILRMATHAIAWAGRPTFPMTAVHTTEEADEWLASRLEADR